MPWASSSVASALVDLALILAALLSYFLFPPSFPASVCPCTPRASPVTCQSAHPASHYRAGTEAPGPHPSPCVHLGPQEQGKGGAEL